MSPESEKKRKLIDRLKDKHRFVILNDTTFEESFVWVLTPLSIFVATGAAIIFLVILGICLIAFTPLREYVPGYADEVSVRKSLYQINSKTDSLERQLALYKIYTDNINNVISGNIKPDSINNKPDTSSKYKALLNKVKPSKQDSAFRAEIESKEKYSLNVGGDKTKQSGVSSFFFFTPIRGLVTNSFNTSDEHFGVDVASKENEAIKSTLDGTVIMAAWTNETGYTMQIQHPNNLVSVYKHCSAMMKKPGDYVKAGEVVGIVGNSGEHSSGPHLHFELWYNGNPIDPQDYMVF